MDSKINLPASYSREDRTEQSFETGHFRPVAAFLRKLARPLAALTLVAIGYFLARKGLPPKSYLQELASNFSFDSYVILPQTSSIRNVRIVHPDFRINSAWISSVGAAVSLGDLDGNGKPDEAVVVDPRTDIVTLVKLQPTGTIELCVLDAPSANFPCAAPMGTVIGDFDEDGKQDVLAYYWGRTPVVYLNIGVSRNSTLTAKSFRPVELIPWENGSPQKWFTNCVTQADLDGDGHIDLIVGNYFPDGSEVLDPKGHHHQWMQASMSKAFNGGSKYFLLWQSPTKQKPVNFYIQNQELFSDSKIEYEAMHGWTLAVATADLNGDLLPEIYFANDFGPDRLFVNLSSPGHLKFKIAEGERHLTTPKSKVLGKDSFKGMGVDFVDLTNEGRFSILVSNIAESFALLESHFAFVPHNATALLDQGIAPFDDRSEQLGLSRSGWGWDIKGADFDNDGYLEVVQALGFMAGETSRWPELQEIAMGNDQLLSSTLSWARLQPGDNLSGNSHLAFFARTAVDQKFHDIGKVLGFPAQTVSRGIAIGDIDRDGRPDFALANQWQDSILYYNRSRTKHAYLGVRVFRRPGVTSQPSAFKNEINLDPTGLIPIIGASVTIYLPDGSQRTAIIDGGNGHSGRRSPEAEFGLGEMLAGTKVPVRVCWRDHDGIHEAWGEIAAGTSGRRNGWYSIVLENESIASQSTRQKFATNSHE